MVLSRRDGGSLTGLSLGMLCLGIGSLAIASALCVYFYIQIRRDRRLRLRLAAEEKLAKVGQPMLQRAPQHVVDSSLSMSRMTGEMRDHFARRHFQPVSTAQAYMNTGMPATMAQSSSGSSGGTNSSGPMPTSSSEETTVSRAKASEESSSTFHSLVDSRAGPSGSSVQRPAIAVTGAGTPSFARQKPIIRDAVPSALLRGLGDLPQLPALTNTGHLSPNPDRGNEDEGSYTPVLGLDLELNAKTGGSNNLEDDLEFEIERSRWLTSTLTSAFDCSTPKKATFDLEAQMQPPPAPTQERRMTGGPSRVTVDYFSLTGRRSFAPPLAETGKEGRAVPSGHRAKPSNGTLAGDVSPHKKPDFVLPPIPTTAARPAASSSSNSQQAAPSAFRPLSLGLSLHSNSKASSLNAATMFGDVSNTFWSEGPDVSIAPIKSDKSNAQEAGKSSGKESKETLRYTDSFDGTRLADDSSAPANSLEDDAYSAASLHSKTESDVEAVVSHGVPTIVQPSMSPPLLAFMTPHHRAVFPDRLEEGAGSQRESKRGNPDASVAHDGPSDAALAPTSKGFASSLRARARLTLSRSKTASTPIPPVRPVREGEQQSVARASNVASPSSLFRPNSFASSSRSPADTLNSYGPPVETWKVCTDDQSPAFVTPAPSPAALPPALGLGLSDETGAAMEQLSSSLGHGESGLSPSPVLAYRSELPRRGSKSKDRATKRVSSRQSQHSEANRLSRSSAGRLRMSFQEEVLGTPPMRQIASPKYATLSKLSPTLGQAPSMAGSNWTLNRQQHRAQQSSIASSYCDTISTCLSGNSEAVGSYDGDHAQSQRAKLLQMIQQNKGPTKEQQAGSSGADPKGFFNHTARASLVSPPLLRSPSPVKSGSSSKRPMNLTIEVNKAAGEDGMVGPLTAPLTPPLTPNERTPTMATASLAPTLPPSSSSQQFLASAALLEDRSPSLEQEKADRLAKLRPLSLAVSHHQQQQTASARFMATSSLHKSQSSTQSSSSNNSSSATTTTGLSTASSSHSSLFQATNAQTGGGVNSRAAFGPSKRLSRMGASPVGVLPTLSADASPSFLPSTSTPRTHHTGGSYNTSSPHSSSWEMTPSPRFSRASINVGAIPYHSPLSVDTFSSPMLARRR